MERTRVEDKVQEGITGKEIEGNTGWGHPIVLHYKIHNICSYSQTQLSIMSLIKSTHLATGFDQT